MYYNSTKFHGFSADSLREIANLNTFRTASRDPRDSALSLCRPRHEPIVTRYRFRFRAYFKKMTASGTSSLCAVKGEYSFYIFHPRASFESKMGDRNQQSLRVEDVIDRLFMDEDSESERTESDDGWEPESSDETSENGELDHGNDRDQHQARVGPGNIGATASTSGVSAPNTRGARSRGRGCARGRRVSRTETDRLWSEILLCFEVSQVIN